MYIVIKSFRDKQDNNRLYKKGDTFPAAGVKVTKARLNFLCNENPENGAVYLEEVLQTPYIDDGEGVCVNDGFTSDGEDSGAGE